MLYVLDTFALMAYLRREKDFNKVRTIILETLAGKCESYMSVINFGELYYMQSRKSGVIKAETALSLSYADAFAATIAEELNATLVTGDLEYKPLEPNLKILWI